MFNSKCKVLMELDDIRKRCKPTDTIAVSGAFLMDIYEMLFESFRDISVETLVEDDKERDTQFHKKFL